MSFLGIFLILALIGGYLLVGMKVFPMYSDWSSISAALDTLAATPGLAKKGKNEVYKKLNGQLYIDSVRTYDARNAIIAKQKKGENKGKWTVTVNYEAKASLFSNVNIVIDFRKEVVLQ